MARVIPSAVVLACLSAVAFESCFAKDNVAPSVWSVQRVGEAQPGGIGEYTYGLAISPDGRRIATLGERLRIWGAGSGKPVGGTLDISGPLVVWGPDNSTVAAATRDGRIVLADTVKDRILWQASVGTKPVTALAFNTAGNVVAASSESDKVVRILNSAGQELCHGPTPHHGNVIGLVFTEGGKTLVSAGAEGTIRTWDPSSCKELRPAIESKNGLFRVLALHPDGRIVAVASREDPTDKERAGGIEFWDSTTGQQVAAPLRGYGGVYGVVSLTFSEDGNRLMLADMSGNLALVDWRKGQLLARGATEHDDPIVWRTVFSPKGDLVVSAGKDRVLGFWSARVVPLSASPLALSSPTTYTVAGSAPTFSDSGSLVAFNEEGGVVVAETETGRVVFKVTLGHRVYAHALSPDGHWLVAYDGRIRLWHVPTRRQVGEWEHHGAVTFAFNTNNTRLAIGASGSVFLIDCPSGKQIARYQTGEGHQPRFRQLAFDSAGRMLIAVTEGNDAYRLDAATLQPMGESWGPFGDLAFSVDGRRLAASRGLSDSDMTQIVVLDSVSGAQIAGPMEDNIGHQHAIAFTPDGRHLLMAGNNGVVSLWDSASGERLARVTSGAKPRLRDLWFTRDVQRLYACEMGTNIRTDCQSWRVSLQLPEKATRRETPTMALAALAPERDVREFALTSLSNEIDFRTNELTASSRSGMVVFLDAGGGRVLDLTAGGGEERSEATVYEDSVLSADETLVTVPLNDGQVAIFDFRTGKLLTVFDPLGMHTFLADGTLAFDQRSQGILIVDPTSGSELRTLPYEQTPGRVTLLAAGSKHPSIVIGTTEGTLLYGRADSPKEPFKIATGMHNGAVTSITFSPDERLLASGGLDGRIRLFDAQTLKPLGEPWEAHTRAVTAIAFNGDATLLVSGSNDGSIRIWNARTGEPLTRPVVAHSKPVIGIGFEPVSGRVLSLGRDYKLRKWSFPPF